MPDIKLGNISFSNIYRGQTPLSKVYKGQTEIWTAGGGGGLPDPTLTDLFWWYDAGRTSSYPGSGTTITDLSGNGYNGTLVNTPTYTSGDSGYFTLNGTSQYISFSPGTSTFLPNNTSMTLEFVVRFTDDGSTRRTILSQWGSATADQVIQTTRLESGNSNSMWFRTALGTENDIFSGTYGTSGNWEHFMFVMEYGTPGADDFTTRLYYNNVVTPSVNTWPDYSAWRSTTQQFRWGANGDNTQYLQGDIAVMRMYSKALDATERTTNYDLENSRYSFS